MEPSRTGDNPIAGIFLPSRFEFAEHAPQRSFQLLRSPHRNGSGNFGMRGVPRAMQERFEQDEQMSLLEFSSSLGRWHCVSRPVELQQVVQRHSSVRPCTDNRLS